MNLGSYVLTKSNFLLIKQALPSPEKLASFQYQPKWPFFSPFSKCFASKYNLAKFSQKEVVHNCWTHKRSRLRPDGASNMVGAKTGVAVYKNEIESN